jgi:predicted glycosyltransferase
MSSTQIASAAPGTTPPRATGRKVWIDLDNSPHVPFFAPIIEALEQQGHTVLVTARDFAQVCELADMMGLRYLKIGRHHGKNILVKLMGLAVRAVQLAPAVARAKPHLAVSHGSRSQLLLSKLMGIPALVIGDYEHARISSMVRPQWVIVPQVFPNDAWHMAPEKVLKYPGIKEDVYVPRFKPDPGVRADLGLSVSDIVVTVRPPATHAHYHNPESDVIFEAVMERLGREPGVRAVLLPRTPKQESDIRERWKQHFASRKMIIPPHVVDGLNLIWFSDLVISGGGTMNREATALQVPVYSTFRGKIGAVDHYLVDQGRLVLIESVEDVERKIQLVTRERHDTPRIDGSALSTIVKHIGDVMEAECRSPRS